MAIALSVALTALCGCTTVSPVTQLDGDTYIVHASNSGPFRTQDGMLGEAADSADSFCAKRNEKTQVVYIQGPGTGTFFAAPQPSSTIAFRCVAKP